jgi:uncharacterized protein (TIGR00725 family)
VAIHEVCWIAERASVTCARDPGGVIAPGARLRGMEQRGYVGVVGPGAGASAEEVRLADQVGRLLAGAGLVVVTGGLGGVMEGAARGCRLADGTSIGLLPGTDRRGANPHSTVTLPTGLGELRNGLLVRSCDAVLAIGSSWGTLSEVALAARTGVPVVLLGWGALAEHLPTVLPRATTAEEAVARVSVLLRS